MTKKRTRLPTRADLDEHGMVRMLVNTKQGQAVRRVSAVDAREIIYSESGTMDIPEEVEQGELEKQRRVQDFDTMSLDELRVLCKKNDISFTGKPPSVLRRLLIEAGVEAPALEIE